MSDERFAADGGLLQATMPVAGASLDNHRLPGDEPTGQEGGLLQYTSCCRHI